MDTEQLEQNIQNIQDIQQEQNENIENINNAVEELSTTLSTQQEEEEQQQEEQQQEEQQQEETHTEILQNINNNLEVVANVCSFNCFILGVVVAVLLVKMFFNNFL